MSKVLLSLICSILIVSCNSFEEKSKITPLFQAKKLSETMAEKNGGNGQSLSSSKKNYVNFRFKIPLSQDMIGHYDYSAIMEDEKVDAEKMDIINKFLVNMKHKIYNLGIGMGVMNKVRFSTDYQFPDFDSEFIKSVKIKRLFFSLDQCSPQDLDCIDLATKDKLSIKFLKSFFVNLSVIQPHDDMTFLEEPISFLSKSEFKKFEKMAFESTPLIMNEEYRKSHIEDESIYYDVTVAKLSTSEIEKRIRNGEEPESNRVYKFKTSHNHVAVKRLFEGKAFSETVKEVSLVGTTVYVELYREELKDKFFKVINDTGVDIVKLGVDVFERCTIDKCIDLNVTNMDLMPLIRKNPHIKFDTFLSLKKLKYGDFKYNGYVELEVSLDLPL